MLFSFVCLFMSSINIGLGIMSIQSGNYSVASVNFCAAAMLSFCSLLNNKK